MPTYEYRCPAGHEFERFYKTISAAPAEHACPECGAMAGRMLSGGAGLLFKGSGFYLTDYGKNAHRKAAPDKKSESSSGSKSESAAPKGETGSSKSDSAAPKAESSKPKADTKPKAE